MERIRVIGAGPAGGAAALTALGEGAAVEIYEKSRFPRHKVCGEFLSPQTTSLLRDLGVWPAIETEAVPMREMLVTFGHRQRRARLPEPAWGLSRRRLDELLLDAARARGAAFYRERGAPGAGSQRTVVATGRHSREPKGERLFGFKAHFTGPSSDCVELYFFGEKSYLGVSPVEGGRVNVCGIVPESLLARHDFEVDAMLAGYGALAERLRPLHREWDWLHVGPVTFRAPGCEWEVREGEYRCGDALGFVDPFTGSGILSALLTGTLAGRAATRGESVAAYVTGCRRRLYPAYLASQVFRDALARGWAELFVPWIPLSWLFTLTRPRV
ncbi:MAG: FAD-dependent monooxygenase [Bryobacterales bacterium]|nr:FAD-dependent monooxygenase [Bryobacterales bacterium]